MEAQVSMTGWVGSEVDFGHTQATGTSRASFRLACTPRVRRQGVWTDDPTTWLTVTCWRTLAEHVAASLGKGEPVLVLGRLRTQAWEDDQGIRHERLVLDAGSVGHDLVKGTAAFRRASRQQAPTHDDASTADRSEKVDQTAAPDARDAAAGEAAADPEATSGGGDRGIDGQPAVSSTTPMETITTPATNSTRDSTAI